MVLAAAVLAVALVSCSRGPRVIPSGKMQKIYREMLLADQWLDDNPAKKPVADTSWFYEPIFEKYGYTVEDYRKSVDHYLNDPKKYAQMVSKVRDGLSAEALVIEKKVLAEERVSRAADSLVRERARFRPDDLPEFNFRPSGDTVYRGLETYMDARGIYSLRVALADTAFIGPRMAVTCAEEEEDEP